MCIILSLLILLVYGSYDFSNIRCNHDEIHTRRSIERTEAKIVVDYGSHAWETDQIPTNFENIRITLDTTQLDIDSEISKVKREYLKNYILPGAIEKIGNLLMVVPVISKFHVDAGMCGTCDVPDDHVTHGVNDTDTMIYVSGQQTSDCGDSTLAYATYCDTDQFGRPIVGFINFCPEKIKPHETSSYEIGKYMAVGVHEMFHVLGLSAGSFGSYRHPNGTQRDSAVISTTMRGNNVNILATETVKEFVRDHFDCDSLEGAEIEDGGGAGTAGSHPEMRIYNYDFMNGAAPNHPLYSGLSLAILQDSGWYKANFSSADINPWGKDAGCDFALEKCIPNEIPEEGLEPINHFCTASGVIKCTADRKSIGYCDYTQYTSDLPEEFSYFDDSTAGGVELYDYCPLYRQVSFSDSTLTTDCMNIENQPSSLTNTYGEEYGEYSACFNNNIRSALLVGDEEEVGRCFRYECMYDPLRAILIFIDGGINGATSSFLLNCLEGEGGKKKYPTKYPWEGYLVCPEFSTMCFDDTQEFDCPIYCLNGKFKDNCQCECDEGFTGTECEKWKCKDYAYDEEDVCSGNGACVALNSCECNEGYHGENCEYPYCNGLEYTESCSINKSQGICIEHNVCKCFYGFLGKQCQYDYSNIVMEIEKWENFYGGIVTSGESGCGSLSSVGEAIYFSEDDERKLLQSYSSEGNYTLSFKIRMNTEIEDCKVSDSGGSTIVIFLEHKKTSKFISKQTIETIKYDDHSGDWESITINYLSHFEHRLGIEQLNFENGRDQWSISSLHIEEELYYSYTDTSEQFASKEWYENLYSYIIENWIAAAVAAGVVVLIVITLVCITGFTIFVLLLIKKKRNRTTKVLPISYSFYEERMKSMK